MKTMKLFIMKTCPYCQRALRFLTELRAGGDYEAIDVEIIDEREEKELADSYDYYLVPSIFYQGKKLHEGVLSKEELQRILDVVLNDE